MSWAYRVIRTVLPPERATNDERVCHQIAEVYFDDDGKPTGYGEAGDVFDCGDGTGDAIEPLAWVVERYQKALALPVIDFGEQAGNVRVPFDEWQRADRLRTATRALVEKLEAVGDHYRIERGAYAPELAAVRDALGGETGERPAINRAQGED